MLNERFRGDCRCFGKLANVLDGQSMNCVVASMFSLHLSEGSGFHITLDFGKQLGAVLELAGS